MSVDNVHERLLHSTPPEVGKLIDDLASSNDRLWPRRRWPAMRFDGPLAVGAVGGHGPIGYVIEAYVPGERIVFRFTRPAGFDGVHGIEALAEGEGTRLRHFLRMNVRGSARLTWPLVYRPLHDALSEDALNTAEASLGHKAAPRPWSGYVRVLRWILRGVPS